MLPNRGPTRPHFAAPACDWDAGPCHARGHVSPAGPLRRNAPASTGPIASRGEHGRPHLRRPTRVRDLEEQQAYLTAADDGDYVGVSELAGAAGGGAVVDHERITGRVKFRREWLARHGRPAGECRVIQVLGESMEPTHVDGCSILVNQASRRRRVARIFVVRTEDGLVVKRAGKDRADAWLLVSDNPNKQAWPTVPWPDDASVIGKVKWAARTFV